MATASSLLQRVPGRAKQPPPVEVLQLDGRGETRVAGRFSLNASGDVIFRANDSSSRQLLEAIREMQILTEEHVLVTVQGNPDAWLKNLPRNVAGSYLWSRVRSDLRAAEAPLRTAARRPRVTSTLREEAALWARSLGAEKVTDVSEQRREKIRMVIAAGIRRNVPLDRLARQIQGVLPRSDDAPLRAAAIASYETNLALNAAQLELWQEQFGRRVEHVWQPVGDSCPICLEMIGTTVRIGEPFELPTGDEVMSPPAHPHCDCFTELFASRGGTR